MFIDIEAVNSVEPKAENSTPEVLDRDTEQGQQARDLVKEAREVATFVAGYVEASGSGKLSIVPATLRALCDEVDALRSDRWNASRVIEWLDDPRRSPAIHAFTAGNERQIAYRYERLLQDLRDVTNCDKCDLCEDHG